jgi:hypothetical protein
MPAGAQGMSVGVQDAVNLGWKLAAAVAGHAPDGLLDTYHSERHPVGERLMRDTRAQTKLYLGGDEMEPLRAVMRELVRLPDAARRLAGQVSGLDIRYDMGPGSHRLLGLRLRPDLTLAHADGTTTTVADLLTTARGLLLLTSEAPDAGALRDLAAGWSDRVDVVTADWDAKETGAHRTAQALLVRPDGHIAWAAPDETGPRPALERWFGRAGEPLEPALAPLRAALS